MRSLARQFELTKVEHDKDPLDREWVVQELSKKILPHVFLAETHHNGWRVMRYVQQAFIAAEAFAHSPHYCDTDEVPRSLALPLYVARVTRDLRQ